MKPLPSRLEKDAGRLIRILPPDVSFVLIGYDPDPEVGLSLEGMASCWRNSQRYFGGHG